MPASDNRSQLRSVGRVNKTTVEALARPSAGGRVALWDTELKGFGVRVTAGGRRTYVLRYRMGGRNAPQRCFTIGPHGSPWTADQARRRAFELLTLVRTGIDPIEQLQTAREESDSASFRRSDRMFDHLADRWFNSHVRGKLRSEADIEGVLRRDLKPAFAGLSIDEITKLKAGEAIDAIGQRSNAAANKAFKWLRQLLNWLIQKGVIEHSPLDRAGRPFKEASRDRVLSLLELTVVWTAAERLPTTFRDFYRMLILVGQRLREVSNLPWAEIDVATAEWVLPARRTKNARSHLVPLSDQACALLGVAEDDQKRRPGPVFTTDGRVGVAGFSKMKEALDQAVSELLEDNPAVAALIGGEVEAWVVHDLRRSLATGCQSLGIPIVVTEAVLNHVSGQRGGIRGVYQLYDFFEEKADALARWGDLIEQALLLWSSGQFEAIMDLDPAMRAKRARRARRRGPKTPKDAKLD